MLPLCRRLLALLFLPGLLFALVPGRVVAQADGPPVAFSLRNTGDTIDCGYAVDNRGTLTVSTLGAPKGDLGRARAHWVSRDTIVWDVIGAPAFSYALHVDPEGEITLDADEIRGGVTVPLSLSPEGPDDALRALFPHLVGFSTLKLDPAALNNVPEYLRGQVVVSARDVEGRLVDATALQIPGVLGDLFFYDGPLGVSFDGDIPTIRVWAPTARRVALQRFADSGADTQPVLSPMSFDEQTGVWSISGDASWKGQFYLFEVEVYVPGEQVVLTNLVTDPYSLSLSTNSTRSQIVNLSDSALKPAGWDALVKPALEAPEDIVLYELHVRDFSSFDETVPEGLRGGFRAFTVADSNGMRHLRELADAGLTHIHLLPVFDIATIEEDPSRRVDLRLKELAALPPDSDRQQALLHWIRDKDGFNWGYDPFHYTVPEGSYSTQPDGPQRIVEFREMVQALSRSGLRVVMDVVYNHTHASGQSEKSVLDKIVPGYYHRLDEKGLVTTSTCCANTATEHAMMEKLMIDSVLTWASQYKIDGFRFDLMGHHMKRNMLKLRAALDGLTIANDGVDGRAIYLYGEGWNFGEVANSARGENAIQLNMAGTGIGTFSDRLRDAVRGGGPFDDPRLQGFASGLFTDPSDFHQGDAGFQRWKLLEYSDWIRLGLAGNLKSYRLSNREGYELTGEQVRYNGMPTGYTLDPQEQIVYVSAHDNATLFDTIQLKAPASASVQERARMVMMALSLTALSQGIPFFHAGDELLRSKSLDRNSYNSSDWFNRIDWSGQSNTFGSGLPPASDNKDHWWIMQPLLANPALRPDPATMAATYASFREMIAIRKSTPLFRLRSAEDVQRMVSFFNTGPDQLPGLIVMSISDNGPTRLDPNIGQVIVLFNARNEDVSYSVPQLSGAALNLHDIQERSTDARVARASFTSASATFNVPARTTSVFVGGQPQVGAPGSDVTTATPTPGSTATPTPGPAAAPDLVATAAPTTTASPARAPGGGLSPATLFGASAAAILGIAAGLYFARRRK